MVVAHDHLEQLVALCSWGIHETNARAQSKFYTAGNQLYLCSSPFCRSLCLWFWIFLWIFFAFTFVSTAFASSASSTKSARTNTAVVPPALALVFGLVLALCSRCDQLPLVVDLDLKMKFLAVTSKQTLESRHDAPCHSSSWSP